MITPWTAGSARSSSFDRHRHAEMLAERREALLVGGIGIGDTDELDPVDAPRDVQTHGHVRVGDAETRYAKWLAQRSSFVVLSPVQERPVRVGRVEQTVGDGT